MIGIVDYNAGNIKSVERALDAINAPYISAKTPKEVENADKLIFPGVGEASYAMSELKKSGFDVFLKEWAEAEKPLMGICLGSQIIFDYSEEGQTKCLCLVPGVIKHFSSIWKEIEKPCSLAFEEKDTNMEENYFLKVPHIGWNDVTFSNGGSRLLADIPSGSNFYFVHSYVIQPDEPTTIKGFSSYGSMVPAIIEYKSISAFQFHPEKSGAVGLKILQNFAS